MYGCTVMISSMRAATVISELDEWAAKIKSWTEQGCDVYVYCDNDAKVRAPYDAMGLMDRLGLSSRGSARCDRRKRSPAYPKELTYPCCRQALGELGELSPHEGPENECTGSIGTDEFGGVGWSVLVGSTDGSPLMMPTTKTRALDLSRSTDRAFVHLLVNTLLVSVINFTVWFAVTFWVFLETKSVLATGMVAGIFLVTTAVSGIWFGSLVDHHRKKTMMQVSAAVSLAFYAVAFTLYQLTPEQTFTDPASVMLWVFIVLTMFGVITGNIRSIALQDAGNRLDPGGSPGQGQRPGRHDDRESRFWSPR